MSYVMLCHVMSRHVTACPVLSYHGQRPVSQGERPSTSISHVSVLIESYLSLLYVMAIAVCRKVSSRRLMSHVFLLIESCLSLDRVMSLS